MGVQVTTAEWLYFEIEAPSRPLPPVFREMCPISPMQCLWAIDHTQKYGGWIELYLNDETRIETGNCPYVGLCFKDGCYTGFGLGSDETEDLERSMLALMGRPWQSVRDELHAVFMGYTTRRVRALDHPEGRGETITFPDFFRTPVRFYGAGVDVEPVVEYPDTGFESGRRERLGDIDWRRGVLNAVYMYGADERREMNKFEMGRWAEAVGKRAK